ncbi:hypothetical protein SLEP1_g54245 [Rubroshorea leprosula]|uniref:Uncharacterized protein n=1 Tax=Rubroshorea leprosula TaxID=152421 RepID=A0AAV5MDR6_9ROSI|nr:hypothetical protein SLEP1_g54245 [Rubroshorea leprosula]
MATLQKFKLLATQCGVAQSPTRSPSTSPVVHFPRRKSTLRMLLTRTTSRRGVPNQECFVPTSPPEKKKKENDDRDTKGRTLKDLLVSSPPPCGEDEDKSKVFNGKIGGKSEVLPDHSKGLDVGSGSPRTGWVGLRHRPLLRRAWRPMLVSIPE